MHVHRIHPHLSQPCLNHKQRNSCKDLTTRIIIQLVPWVLVSTHRTPPHLNHPYCKIRLQHTRQEPTTSLTFQVVPWVRLRNHHTHHRLNHPYYNTNLEPPSKEPTTRTAMQVTLRVRTPKYRIHRCYSCSQPINKFLWLHRGPTHQITGTVQETPMVCLLIHHSYPQASNFQKLHKELISPVTPT